MMEKGGTQAYYTCQEFHDEFKYAPQHVALRQKLQNGFKQCCSPEKCFRSIFSVFPVLSWVPNYNFKNWLLPDILSGLTIGIFQIPQGMAYGLLAGVPPIYGLYTSFFPVLIYFVMGTSKHISYGTYAILSLMSSKVVDQYSSVLEPDDMSKNFSFFSDDNMTGQAVDQGNIAPIEVATAACLLVGLYELAAGLLQIGALSVYMSDSMVRAFTTGSAVHVLFSQLKYLFGITMPRYYGPFRLIYTAIAFFERIPNTNYVTLLLSLSAIILLIAIKEGINKRFKSKLFMPVPIELILVVLATIISHFLDLNVSYQVKIVGDIPTGLPKPSIPSLYLVHKIMLDAVPLAIIGYTTSLSIAKIFARKHEYEVDANQELLAHGISNIFACFFSCVPGSTSLSRSSVQEGSGCKTQIASIISAILILLVLLFVGSLLESLPNCMLSAVIVVALKNLLLQVTELRYYWNVSKSDALVWLVTFMAVTILDVDYGLGIGILFSLLAVIYKTQKPFIYLLGKLPRTDIFVDLKTYPSAYRISGVQIFSFCAALNFINKELFMEKVKRLVEENNRIKNGISNEGETNKAYVADPEINGNVTKEITQSDRKFPDKPAKESLDYVIIDASGFSYIDEAGLTALGQLCEIGNKYGVTLILAACPGHVYDTIYKSPLLETWQALNIYPSVQDAILFIIYSQAKEIQSSTLDFAEETHM